MTSLHQIIALLKKQPIFWLGLFGILGGILFSFKKGQLPVIAPNQISLPAVSPYPHHISGLGIVEASSHNISVGLPIDGIIQQVYVQSGDRVKKGDLLILLDDREQKAIVQAALHEVQSLKAKVDALTASLKIAQDVYERDKKLTSGVKSDVEINVSRYTYEKSKAELEEAKAKHLNAQELMLQKQIILEKHSILAPCDGIILKVFNHVGEYVGGMAQTPVLKIGQDQPLWVRVQVDENDLWRYRSKPKATAFLRGNSAFSIPLTFIRFEPYAASKKELNGGNDEQVDTRVVEILFRVDQDKKNKQPTLTIGQALDVFIETNISG